MNQGKQDVSAGDVAAVEKLQQAREKINREIGKVIVGQRENGEGSSGRSIEAAQGF